MPASVSRARRIVAGTSVVICFLFLVASGAYARDLALVGGTIYPSPIDAPIPNGVVLIHNGRIVAVGRRQDVKVPRDAERLNCNGMSVTAGFWNAFATLPAIQKRSSNQLGGALENLFSRWGFTTVFISGAPLSTINNIRARLKSGEVWGPRILATGETIALSNTQSGAKELVAQRVKNGADGITVAVDGPSFSPQAHGLAVSVANAARRHHKPVFVQAQDVAGAKMAGDIHATALVPSAQVVPWPDATISKLLANKTAFVSVPSSAPKAVSILQCYVQANGAILFGGNTTPPKFSTADELALFSKVGMNFGQVLAALTSSPAQVLGEGRHSGRVYRGWSGDLTVVQGDPARDILAFSHVRYTIRRGKIIYEGR